MEQLFDKMLYYINTYGFVSVLIFGLVGIAFTYFGLRVYRLLSFLVGLVCGVILGYSGAAAAGWPESGCALAALLAGVLCGGLALLFIALAAFLLGAVVGVMLASNFISTEPITLVVAGALCGAVFVSLHQLAIVIGTAWCGAGMLTYAGINGLSLLLHGHQAWLPGDFLTYMGRVGNTAYKRGTVAGGFDMLQGDILFFLVIFSSGLLVQLKFHHLFKRKATRRGGPCVQGGHKVRPYMRSYPRGGNCL